MFNRKAISAYIGTVLLLLVCIVSFVALYNWTISENSENRNLIREEKITRTIDILRVDGNLVYLQSTADGTVPLDKITVNGKDCDVGEIILDKDINVVDIGSCTQGLDPEQVYSVGIFSPLGITSESEYLFGGPVNTGLIFKYEIGPCDFASGFIKIYGLSAISNAHIEDSSSDSYTYNACAKHTDYTLGTSSSGNFINLAYLPSETNSMVFTSKDDTIAEVSQWHDLSISSSGGSFDLVVSSESLSSQNYTCVGRLDLDNVYGSHFGDCHSSHNTTLWLKLG